MLSIFIGMVIYGLSVGHLFESLLVLVTWLQLELGIIQLELQRALLDPRLTARVVEEVADEGGDKGKRTRRVLVLENSGQTAAHFVKVTRVLDASDKPVPFEEWDRYLRILTWVVDLAPGQRSEVAEIIDPLKLNGMFIEVEYTTTHRLREPVKVLITAFGDPRNVLRVEAITMPPRSSRITMPPLLTGSIRHLLIVIVYVIERYIWKIGETKITLEPIKAESETAAP